MNQLGYFHSPAARAPLISRLQRLKLISVVVDPRASPLAITFHAFSVKTRPLTQAALTSFPRYNQPE